jgi:hypothetical protein
LCCGLDASLQSKLHTTTTTAATATTTTGRTGSDDGAQRNSRAGRILA